VHGGRGQRSEVSGQKPEEEKSEVRGRVKTEKRKPFSRKTGNTGTQEVTQEGREVVPDL
jgi:hypothetical protein